MRSFLRPIPLVAFALAVVMFVLQQPILGTIFFVVWISALALDSLRKTAEMRANDVVDDLDPESKTLFAPIKRLTAEIEEVVERYGDSPVVKAVGGDAQREAERIRNQILRALSARSEIKRALRGRSLAERETTELEQRVADAASPEEKASLEVALTTRKREVTHYLEVETALNRIDRGVEQARAALSEMKTRLQVGASGERASRDSSEDELRETLRNLRALSVSYEEAAESLGDNRGT